MLVVTRKAGEKIIIPQAGIEITIVATLPNGRVRIGVQAPEDTKVFREELLSRTEARKCPTTR
jgi:carbon storage regulator CsrA